MIVESDRGQGRTIARVSVRASDLSTLAECLTVLREADEQSYPNCWLEVLERQHEWRLRVLATDGYRLAVRDAPVSDVTGCAVAVKIDTADAIRFGSWIARRAPGRIVAVTLSTDGWTAEACGSVFRALSPPYRQDWYRSLLDHAQPCYAVVQRCQLVALVGARLEAIEAEAKRALKLAMGDAEALTVDGDVAVTWRTVTSQRLDTTALRRLTDRAAAQGEASAEEFRRALEQAEQLLAAREDAADVAGRQMRHGGVRRARLGPPLATCAEGEEVRIGGQLALCGNTAPARVIADAVLPARVGADLAAAVWRLEEVET